MYHIIGLFSLFLDLCSKYVWLCKLTIYCMLMRLKLCTIIHRGGGVIGNENGRAASLIFISVLGYKLPASKRERNPGLSDSKCVIDHLIRPVYGAAVTLSSTGTAVSQAHFRQKQVQQLLPSAILWPSWIIYGLSRKWCGPGDGLGGAEKSESSLSGLVST